MIESIKCGCGEYMVFRLQEDSEKESWVCNACDQRVIIEVVDKSTYKPRGTAVIQDIVKDGINLKSFAVNKGDAGIERHTATD